MQTLASLYARIDSGNVPGAGINGEMTVGSLVRMFRDVFNRDCGISPTSTWSFFDLGHGRGKVAFVAAMFGAAWSTGIEVSRQRYWLSMVALQRSLDPHMWKANVRSAVC